MPDPETEPAPESPVETPAATPIETPVPVVQLDPGYLEHGASHDGAETRQ